MRPDQVGALGVFHAYLPKVSKSLLSKETDSLHGPVASHTETTSPAKDLKDQRDKKALAMLGFLQPDDFTKAVESTGVRWCEGVV